MNRTLRPISRTRTSTRTRAAGIHRHCWPLALLVAMCALTLGLAANTAHAQFPGFDQPQQGQPMFGDSRDRIRTSAQPGLASAMPGSVVPLAVVFDMDPKWHMWTQRGGTPEGVGRFDGAVHTEINVELPAGAPLQVPASAIQWPEPHIGPVSGMGEMATFDGKAIAFVPILIAADAQPGEHQLTLKLTFQACDDATCLMPVFNHALLVRLTIEAGEAMPLTDRELPALFSELNRTAFDALAQAAADAAQQEAALPAATASSDAVRITVQPQSTQVPQGGDSVIAVVLDHRPGWHTWTQANVELPEHYSVFEYAIHTEVAMQTSSPAAVTAHVNHAQWPAFKGERVQLEPDEPAGLFAVFANTSVIYVPLTIAADAPRGTVELSITTTLQACDDTSCLPPSDVVRTIALEIVAPDHAINRSADALWSEFDPSVFAAVHADPDRSTPVTDPALDDESTLAGGAGPQFFGFTLPSTDGVLGLILLAVFSAIGGFLLNLTPCVLPVIPIKIMTIMQHANKPGKNLVLGMWMAAGVVAFWMALGLPVAFVAGVTDPSRLFGIWWLTLGIGVLIALMGIGIMGLFTIQLPQSVYAVNPKADSPGGSFMFGVMTAVLGLPCFGFVAGALLAGAATMPPGTIMTIFTALGVGMAFPYLVLSAKPSLIERIPRTGPASELIKQVMGLLLLAAAAYFIGSGLIALVSDRPYLGRQLHWWAVAVFAGLAALWMIIRTVQITQNAMPRVSMSVIALLLGGAAVMYALDSTERARSDWQARQDAIAAAGGSSSGYITGSWNYWTPAAFAQAREDGQIVLLDFTAEWCINCKMLKAAILDRDPVRSEIANQDVVKFIVDLTSTTAPGWEFMRDDLGHQAGIPLLAIYTPGNDDPWMSTAYTAPQVMAALQRARDARENGAVARRYVTGSWNHWTPSAFQQAREDGHIVLLDFTAEWSINCKALQAAILDRDPVHSEIANQDVVKFTVDLTTTSAPGWNFLRDDLGHQAGPPLLAIYTPGNDEPWMSTAYTTPQVMAALQRARNARQWSGGAAITY